MDSIIEIILVLAFILTIYASLNLIYSKLKNKNLKKQKQILFYSLGLVIICSLILGIFKSKPADITNNDNEKQEKSTINDSGNTNSDDNPSYALPLIIGISSLSALIVYLVRIPARKQKRKMQMLKEKYGINNIAYVNHEYGLTLPEDIQCKLTSFNDRIEIEGNNMRINLYKKDIVNTYLKTDVEITSQYVSSAGDAIAGAMMYGPLGASFFGRVKEKKHKETHHYLIITYNKDNEINFIGFDATYNYPQATNLVVEIKAGLSEKKVVDL